MSGGHWNYTNDCVCNEIFNMSPDYGDRGFNKSAYARARNPLEDSEISELVYDVFCLLHSADWYFSSDTGEETYRADIRRFKEKWFSVNPEVRVEREISAELNRARESLSKIFGVDLAEKNDTETIKIKYFKPDVAPVVAINGGDWMDLRAAETVEIKKGEYALIPLGVGMILPKGYEAHVAPRSSTPKNFGILLANSIGIIDNSYSGDLDEWHFPAVAIRDTVIHAGDRIAQFRIVKNQPTITFETVKFNPPLPQRAK